MAYRRRRLRRRSLRARRSVSRRRGGVNRIGYRL